MQVEGSFMDLVIGVKVNLNLNVPKFTFSTFRCQWVFVGDSQGPDTVTTGVNRVGGNCCSPSKDKAALYALPAALVQPVCSPITDNVKTILEIP